MTSFPSVENGAQLFLDATTAADLMRPNIPSIREETTVKEAVTFLIDRGLSAIPVINAASQPVGVLSRADILVHDREKPNMTASIRPEAPEDATLVRDIMTPAVFSITTDTSPLKVIDEMVAMNVQQLFVVDRGGILTGMISAFDILSHLRH